MRPLTAACLVLSLSFVACNDSRPVDAISESSSAAQLLRGTYSSTATDKERDYYVYLPAGYEPGGERLWPVLLFLHGGGERGDGKEDLDRVLALGPFYEAWIQKRDLPFLIVAPQLPLFGRDQIDPYLKNRDRSMMPRRLEVGVPARPTEFRTRGPLSGAPAEPALPYDATGLPDGWPRCEGDLLLVLDQVLGARLADPTRVYLTGVSYGGFGTWHLASRHPERFAAIAPLVAWGHPDLMPPLVARQVPLWVFAGGRDRVMPIRFFYPGLNALERAGHEQVLFTVHEDMGHDVWARVYSGNDLYEWLLSHRLPGSLSPGPARPPPPAVSG